MNDALIGTGMLQIRSHHGTWLACGRDGFKLAIDERDPSTALARRIGETGLAIVHAPMASGSPARVVPAILHGQERSSVSIELADGGVLTATPHQLIETGRSVVGDWERFSLEPAPRPLPPILTPILEAEYLASFAGADPDWDALETDCRARGRVLARDPGIDAVLLSLLPAERLRRLLSELRDRDDYDRLFPSIQARLANGQRRSEWHTRSHLGPDLPLGWSVGDHSYGAPEIIDGEYGRLAIGRYCSIAGGVRIVVANHATDTLTTYPFTALRRFWPSATIEQPDHAGTGVVIGSHVWIGAGACLLPGARIGHGAILGAHAVVAGTVPPYAVAVGNPARVVRLRFDEVTVRRLLACAWWDWPDHQVDRALALLMGRDPAPLFAFAERHGLAGSETIRPQFEASSASNRACERAP